MMNSGSGASFGIGRVVSIGGSSTARPPLCMPMISPTGTPATMHTANAIPKRLLGLLPPGPADRPVALTEDFGDREPAVGLSGGFCRGLPARDEADQTRGVRQQST
jgi:hypothetical protein